VEVLLNMAKKISTLKSVCESLGLAHIGVISGNTVDSNRVSAVMWFLLEVESL